MIRLALLLHMHQPLYTDPESGKAALPWVRLHGIKDYSGIPLVLRQYPEVKTTVNLVPSLLGQLENYLEGGRDIFQEMAAKPAVDLNHRDRVFMARHFFSAHPEQMIRPFPRYRELHDRRQELERGGGTPGDWRDLQVWSSLAWFDADRAQADERVRELRNRGRDFSETDKAILVAAQRDHLAGIVPAWRELQDLGLVEIATSPMTHAILPLLLDPQAGREANPRLPAYNLCFHWPDDARRHLKEALDFMNQRFGRRPRGIWPSEGSLSEGVLEILDELGIAWTASDEINLGRSLVLQGDREWPAGRDNLLYRPWTAGGRDIRILFRDHDLSDRIGFRYQGMDPARAVEDFMARLREIDRQAGDPVVTVILDGENPWEHYPGNGRPFLHALLQRLRDSEMVETVSMSEAAAAETGNLRHLAPGSWIGGNFDIWIGDESDRRAWELLAKTRECYLQAREKMSPEDESMARRCLDVAQGSDWYWWFGPEHHTADLDVFDRLFRTNLKRVYELAGMDPPSELLVPVCRDTEGNAPATRPPRRPLRPTLDGRDSHFFEWRHAGRLDVHAGSGAMNPGESLLRAVFYGFDTRRFFLRVDTRGGAAAVINAGNRLRLDLRIAGKPDRAVDIPMDPRMGECAIAEVVECGIELSALGLEEKDNFELSLELRKDKRIRQRLPVDGYYALTVPGPQDYAEYWIV